MGYDLSQTLFLPLFAIWRRYWLEERVTSEIGFDATPGDVHEAEGTRLRLQGVTPCGGGKRVVVCPNLAIFTQPPNM